MRTAPALMVLLVGCTRLPVAAPPPDEATSPPSGSHAPLEQDAATDAGSLTPANGSFGYRGKIGPHAIAMTLDIAGGTIRGAYAYEPAGRDLALAGALSPDGTTALTESFAGKTSGSFRLRPTDAGLGGEWSSPDGTKSLPVELARITPRSGTFTQQAEACLADPSCLAVEASRLFVAADDAHETLADCWRFLDGVGVPRDVVRARACLERDVASLHVAAGCRDGSSAGNDQADLAMLRIDGIGGPQDIAGARSLLDQCFDDVTKQGILEHAAEKERAPATKAVGFCRELGGTTLTWNTCAARARSAEWTNALLVEKRISARLDANGKRSLAAAHSAYERYVSAEGRFVYEVYLDGSQRNVLALGREQALIAERAKAIARFDSFVTKDVGADAVVRASRAVDVALAKVQTSTPAEITALLSTQETWLAYRDAEAALYVGAFGATQGADRVRATILVDVAQRRAGECEPPSLAP
jgi:hypothetical protein